jgi:hypothetical protein
MKFIGLCLALFTVPAVAEPLGVRFDEIPVGCRIHREKSTGEHQITEYIGTDGSNHIMETYAGPAGTRLIHKTTYSPDGLMVRLDKADGAWETYSPGICVLNEGRCSYVFRNSSGREQHLQGDGIRDGDVFTIAFRTAGASQFQTLVITVGRFNLPEVYQSGDLTITITRYDDCSLGS